MSEPMKKEMLEWLKEQEEDLWRPIRLSSMPPPQYHLEKREIIHAIRRLVEKFFEWQERARKFIDEDLRSPSWADLRWMDLLREIRDFGEGK